MNHSKLLISFSLLVAVLTLTAGCEQAVSKDQAETPTIKPQIIIDCIASYYQQDNAAYITQQTHGFNPQARYLQITANEPTGQYIFTWLNGAFNAAKEPTAFLSGLPASFVNANLSAALFYGFTGGAELLNDDAYRPLDNVKLEGQWYLALQVPTGQNVPSITLYRNLTTARIERAKIEAGSAQWLLEIYNFRYSRDLDNMLPRQIDVFDISRGLASKKRIIQFEYKGVLKQPAMAAMN